MKYIDYMSQNPTMNFEWCKPFANKDETHFLVIYDGIPDSIDTPDVVSHRLGGFNFDAALEQLAREVNPDYDVYSGYTDHQIALMAMHEIGCSNCPFRFECDAMDEEVGATDNN